MLRLMTYSNDVFLTPLHFVSFLMIHSPITKRNLYLSTNYDNASQKVLFPGLEPTHERWWSQWCISGLFSERSRFLVCSAVTVRPSVCLTHSCAPPAPNYQPVAIGYGHTSPYAQASPFTLAVDRFVWLVYPQDKKPSRLFSITPANLEILAL